MFPASLLVLMILLLPQASSSHQEGPSQTHGNLASPLEPSLAHTIQNLLLTRLGLQSHPNPSEEAKVPQYLLDLYRFHTQQYHLIEDPEFNYPSQHVQGANTVRCFHHTGMSNYRTRSSRTPISLAVVKSCPLKKLPVFRYFSLKSWH